jgi:hypothetical protein
MIVRTVMTAIAAPPFGLHFPNLARDYFDISWKRAAPGIKPGETEMLMTGCRTDRNKEKGRVNPLPEILG